MSSLPAPLSWANAGAAINAPPSKIAARIFMSPLLRLCVRQFNLQQMERQRPLDRGDPAKRPLSSQLGGIIATFGGNSAWNSGTQHDRRVILALAVPRQDSGAKSCPGNRR